MKVVERKIEGLVPDAANVRMHSEANIQAICASLKRWGQQKPIVIDEKNIIRCGNGTYEAAKKLGWEKISCVCSDLKGSELAAYSIADNRTAELAEWSRELESLPEAIKQDIPDLDFAEHHFDDIEALIKEHEEIQNGLTEPDAAPEIPVDPESKAGEIYRLGEHLLMCGDSTNETDVKKLMNGSQADLWLTDPPYNVCRMYLIAA